MSLEDLLYDFLESYDFLLSLPLQLVMLEDVIAQENHVNFTFQ